jgi:hypothetical protein
MLGTLQAMIGEVFRWIFAETNGWINEFQRWDLESRTMFAGWLISQALLIWLWARFARGPKIK